MNILERHAKPFSDDAVTQSFCPQLADGANIIRSQTCGATLDSFWAMPTQNVASMADILQTHHVFKILKMIVRTASVFVVDLMAFGGWSKKCPSYKHVNIELPAVNARKSYTHITSQYRLESIAAFGVFAVARLSYAAHVPAIAHLVKAFIANYWKPAFDCHAVTIACTSHRIQLL